jgi:3-phenylpropionate/trans-cinnamate dioxygenase ferredoxin subunit
LTELVDVGATDDFPVDKPVVVSVRGRQVAIVRRGEAEFYAIRNVCPHQTASFAAGWITPGFHSNTPGEMRFDDTSPVVHCPRHSWGYRLTDGTSTGDPSLRVRTFPTSCDGGRVFIDVSRGRART